MRKVPLLAAIGLVSVASACESDPSGLPSEASVDLARPWATTSASSVGLDANALFVAGERGSEIDRLQSLLVVKDGAIVFERYYGENGPDDLVDVRSVTKSIVALLTGVAIESGIITSVDDPITDYLDGSYLAARPELEAITVRHLLTMSSGLRWAGDAGGSAYSHWLTSGEHIDYVLGQPFVAIPGEAFQYNSGAIHLLGVILEEAAGLPLEEFARSVLFEPLGIPDQEWETLPGDYVNGGAGIDLRPRDLARIGQLVLQGGWSGSQRIVAEAWVDESLTPLWGDLGTVGPVPLLSYGYLWWLDVERNSYFAWGYGGQFVYVDPVNRMVTVATTDWVDVSEDIGSAALQEAVLTMIVEDVRRALPG